MWDHDRAVCGLCLKVDGIHLFLLSVLFVLNVLAFVFEVVDGWMTTWMVTWHKHEHSLVFFMLASVPTMYFIADGNVCVCVLHWAGFRGKWGIKQAPLVSPALLLTCQQFTLKQKRFGEDGEVVGTEREMWSCQSCLTSSCLCWVSMAVRLFQVERRECPDVCVSQDAAVKQMPRRAACS